MVKLQNQCVVLLKISLTKIELQVGDFDNKHFVMESVKNKTERYDNSISFIDSTSTPCDISTRW